MFEVKTRLKIEFDEKELSTVISNVIFDICKENNGKIKDMTLWQLLNYIPDVIAKEIIEQKQDIVKIEKLD